MKRVIIVHRWGGSPTDDWYQSVSNSLKQKEFMVEIPEMPETDKPSINKWIKKLESVIPSPSKDTIFIGHSIGCQTILRYIERLPIETSLGKLILVAPWFHLENLEDKESEKIVMPWLETPINFEKIKRHTSEIICLFSDNDPWVPITDAELFKKKLGAKIIIKHSAGHFNTPELPDIIKEIIS